jgi:phosphoenolpyruvate carboxykinase (ATP)
MKKNIFYKTQWRPDRSPFLFGGGIVDNNQLREIGLKTSKNIYYDLQVPNLVEAAVKRGEGELARNGALVVTTGERTGRSPKDRYIVETDGVRDHIWWGDVNRPASQEQFDHLLKRVSDFLVDKELFVFDAFCGADRRYRMPVRVVSQKAWHSLFARTLFVRPFQEELEDFEPSFTVINACDLKLDPKKDGFDSEVAVLVNLEKRMILIAGTGYGGEMKKGIFSVMNYILPDRGVFPMHCSSNVGKRGDTALFFGLSGTGKTSLSADADRRLIGDDEHGWSDDGIFNMEGGCYAKCIRLSKKSEPQIYNAIRFGSILENVVLNDETRKVNFSSSRITENTRATYPVEFIPNCVTEGLGSHPKNIFFLTCDAFGVLPPISKLTPEMAMYHFILGYTAKVAGTEYGNVEPVATFSTCFASPFLPRHPNVYAEQLRDKLERHETNCWLLNTGWSGGAYGVGSRMEISITQTLLEAAFTGGLNNVAYKPHPIFRVLVPETCPGVHLEILSPEKTWRGQSTYRESAQKVAGRFVENFKKYEDKVSANVIAAGTPNLS